ncbi:MAG: hypothetical protein ACFE7R_01615 [Candidatus Hodarchaeota archaeon]
MVGCHVEVSSATQLVTRTRMITIAALVQIIRAFGLFGGIILIPEALVGYGTLGLLEILSAVWLLTLRMESWSISTGMALFHLLWPQSIFHSFLLFVLLAMTSIISLILLAIVKWRRHYSFTALAQVETGLEWEPSTMQTRVFQLVVLAQLIKSGFLFIASYILFPVEVAWTPIPEIGILNPMPTVLLLAILELITGTELYRGKEWAFHLTLVLATLGFYETLLSLSSPVFLVSIWIILLMAMCLPKDGFYGKLRQRIFFKTNTQTYITVEQK